MTSAREGLFFLFIIAIVVILAIILIPWENMDEWFVGEWSGIRPTIIFDVYPTVVTLPTWTALPNIAYPTQMPWPTLKPIPTWPSP